jgi:ribosomal-protein-alanine N-acetyltransferase
MIISRASAEEDLAALARLHALSFAQAWTEDALRKLLKTPGSAAFATQGGFVLVRTAGDEAEIITLAVAPDVRRRGIASALLRSAAAHALKAGARTMFLEVSESNEAANALYARAGFREAGRRKSYYGPSDDALVLRGDLPLVPLGNSTASTRL